MNNSKQSAPTEKTCSLTSTFKDIEHSIIVHALQQVICGTEVDDFQFPVLPEPVFGNDDDADADTSKANVVKKYKGIRKRASGKWAAEIHDPSRGKNLWIGTFCTAEEAATAYDLKAVEFRREKAKTNFPLSEYSEMLRAVNNDDNAKNKTGSERAIGNDYNATNVTVSEGAMVTEIMEANVSSNDLENNQENAYDWIFEEDDSYVLPEWKIVNTP